MPQLKKGIRFIFEDELGIIVVGGASGRNDVSEVCYRVDKKGRVTTLPDLIERRESCSLWVVTWNNKALIVVGGNGAGKKVLNTWEIISFETILNQRSIFEEELNTEDENLKLQSNETWELTSSLRKPRANSSLVEVNKYLYWFGGYDRSQKEPHLDTIERLNFH